MQDPLLRVIDLNTSFKLGDNIVRAVDGIHLNINHAETTAIVGESGSGKSATLLSILRLIQSPPGNIRAGEISFQGRNLLSLSEKAMREIRGNEISMIFQEPMSSLNPVFRIGYQIIEAISRHQKVSKGEATEKAIEMLRLVNIPDPEKRIKNYPNQLSGGMRQRVMIAMALSCNPKLLFADEPTTALDVTIQAQILDLIKKLRRELGMAILLVTHDLGAVAEMAQRVLVMYAGKIIEESNILPIFKNPLHPYTEGLLKSIPRIDLDSEKLHVIEGDLPKASSFPDGCRFHPRCIYAFEECRRIEPDLCEISPGHFAACHLAKERVRDL